ncbi:MAG: D-inositol-3-phosphate glycosyltransferase [Candidatus Sumerlaeota bacterium]|nr:D-inositol-3-phosphate glycosyltransferase [Candidatus Sumerlaeota bacterium]
MPPFSRHLVLDARTIRPGASGVGHYVAGLLDGLGECLAAGAPWRVTAIVLRGTSGEIPAPIEVLETDADYERHPSGDWWLHGELPRLVERLGGDVLVSPAFLAPAGRRRFARLVGVLDSLAWDDPATVPLPFRTYLKTATRLGAWGADGLFTLSPPAARRLRALGFRNGLHSVLPPAFDPERFRAGGGGGGVLPDGTPKQRPLILYTASFEPRKNHQVLFEALRHPALAACGADLVLLDRRAPELAAAFERRTRGLAVRFVAPEGLAGVAAWTRAADAVAFPSRSEGFGMPALEAMACGVPLVASDIDVMRWLTVRGRCAHLVAPHDAAAWARALARALEDPHSSEWNARVADGMRRAARFSWRRTAGLLLAMAGKAARSR